MPSAGPNSPATIVDDASFGESAWSNPGNAASSNNAYATVTLSATDRSHYLKATNLGFSIASGATIDGIVAEAEVSIPFEASGNGPSDVRARLVKAGTIGATDRSSATNWGTLDTYLSHGGSTDLWGETWTDSDINAIDFGFALAAQSDGGDTGQVDHIRITVYYTTSDGQRHQQTRVRVVKDSCPFVRTQ